MPKLSDNQRTSIEERLALHKEIEARYEGHQYQNQRCYLCGWASNGLTFDEAIAENRRHIQAVHAAEDALMKATTIPMQELRDSLHDHDCIERYCACMCGCTDGPFCALVMGALCSTCVVAGGRGHSEHGELNGG